MKSDYIVIDNILNAVHLIPMTHLFFYFLLTSQFYYIKKIYWSIVDLLC